MFKNQMKAKRRKTGDGGAKKNEKGNILERQELVVQRLSSEVSSKASSRTRDSRPIANDYELSSSRQQFFSEPVKPPQPAGPKQGTKHWFTKCKTFNSQEFVHFAYDEAWEACQAK